MSLGITSVVEGEVLVLALVGTITTEDNYYAVKVAIYGAINSDRRRIVLDLKEVTEIDYLGWDVILEGFKYVADHSGQLRLVNPQQNVLDYLQITKLDSVFEVHTSLAAALTSFAT